MPVSFGDEENDSPIFRDHTGSAGWTTNDESFLVYDRYDIWSFDPDGKRAPVNLTRIGRENKIVFRYLRLDNEMRFIDPAQELLLSAFRETTKESGFYRLSRRQANHAITGSTIPDLAVGKARSAQQIIYTRESFREFPDVWTADMNFTATQDLRRQPSNEEILWGVEPVRWTSLDNIPLQGMLYKPEGFDPNKKYPMIVYFYEKEKAITCTSTSNLNRCVLPSTVRCM